MNNISPQAVSVHAKPLCIQESVSLADKTWFQTGGIARWFSAPATALEFKQVIQWAAASALPIDIIGEGANILVSDAGPQALVIRPAIKDSAITARDDQHALVTAGAGVSFADLITWSLDHQLLGLEEFSGIPGTVGGSVYINIHYFRFLLSDFLVGATVIHAQTGEIQQVDHAWFHFGYNQSTLQAGNYFLVDATLRLKSASEIETAYARGRSVEMIRHRQQRYPMKRTCGSFFRNFYPDEVTLVSNGKKMIYVAYYFDKLGIKGELRVGGAQVSHQHANMIVTDETATSADVVALARTMQQMVSDSFGIVPQPECQFIGFESNPLL